MRLAHSESKEKITPGLPDQREPGVWPNDACQTTISTVLKHKAV